MKRGWIAGTGILLFLFGSAEIIYHLRGNDLAVEVAGGCVLLVAMYACFRIAKWADTAPKSHPATALAYAPVSSAVPDPDPEPSELLSELRALGYTMQREGKRWVVTEADGSISLYYSSNEALRNDADALRKRSPRSKPAEA